MNTQELRHSARLIWEAALNAANPATCIRKFLQLRDKVLIAGGKEIAIRGRLIVIGAGKASAKMAQIAEEILGSHISGGIIVTKYGHALPLQRMRLVEAAHPIPDGAGVRAVYESRELLRGVSEDDIVLVLISGGGSALWPAPAGGITLEEKQQTTSLLLRAGATIRELNAVRKHLSDVIGDPIDFIASGPTAPDTTSFSDALAIVEKYALDIPDAVRERFQEGARGAIPDTPKPGDPIFKKVDNRVIANNRLLADAAADKARELRFNTLLLGTELEGEAKDLGLFFAAIARETARTGNPIRSPACILAAGETTVTLHGNGTGGRNQEMALAWAISVASRPFSSQACFASVATDGSDGPTSAAGGLVDPFTCSRAIELGLMPQNFLRSNDSFNFLKATGDLIITGPTQTNLMDLQILLIG